MKDAGVLEIWKERNSPDQRSALNKQSISPTFAADHITTSCLLYIPHSIRQAHTRTRLTALCLGLPGWAGTRKVKPIWILLKHETVSGSGISWNICKYAPRSRQITIPAPHCSLCVTLKLSVGCEEVYLACSEHCAQNLFDILYITELD